MTKVPHVLECIFSRKGQNVKFFPEKEKMCVYPQAKKAYSTDSENRKKIRPIQNAYRTDLILSII
jgi:hypothetical protein